MRHATLLIFAFLISSCAYRVEKEGEPTAKLNANAMGFSEVQAAILGPKCARCHSDWAASYEGVVANLAEISARVASADPGFMMPPPGRGTLTAEEKAALQGWISRGAPQFADGGTGNQPVNPAPNPGPNPPEPPKNSPTPVPAPPGLNFANVQEKVFTPKCSRCHGFVESYDGVVARLAGIESRVRSPLEFEQMPPPKAAQLTDEEKNLLLDWIKAGAPENSDGEGVTPGPSPQPPKDCEDRDDDDHEEDDLVTHKKCDKNKDERNNQ